MASSRRRWAVLFYFVVAACCLVSSGCDAAEAPAAKIPPEARFDFATPRPGLIAQLASNRFRVVGQIQVCRLSPLGTRLVTIGTMDWLQLWDVEKGKLLAELKSARNGPMDPAVHQRIAWSGDSKYLAAIDLRGDVQIFDAATGKILSTLTGEQIAGAHRLIFGPDHKTLLVGRRGKMPAIDVTTGQTLREFDIGENTPTHLLLRQEGTILDAFSGRSGHFRWRWADASFVDRGSSTFLDYFSPSDFHVDGTVFNGESNKLVFRSEPGNKLHQFSTEGKKVSAVARTADHQWIAAGHEDGEVSLWSTKDKSLTARWQALPGEINFLSLSHDGQVAAVASASANPANMSGHRVTLWKKQGGQYQELFPDHDHKALIDWLAFSADGKRLISASNDHTLGIWDLAKRERSGSLEYREKSSYTPATDCVSIHRWNRENRFIQLYDLSDSKQIKMKADFEGFRDNALSPDGKMLATSTYIKLNGTNRPPPKLTLYDLGGAAAPRTIDVESNSFYTLRWSPNSELLVTASGAPTVWNTRTGEKLLQADKNASPHIVGFSSDSKQLFGFVDNGGQMQKSKFLVYDIATQQQVHQFVLPSRCYSIVPLQDTRRVLLGCQDGTLRVYDLTTEKLSKEIPLHSHLIRALAISPDEQQFATGHDDGAIFLWDAKILSAVEK